MTFGEFDYACKKAQFNRYKEIVSKYTDTRWSRPGELEQELKDAAAIVNGFRPKTVIADELNKHSKNNNKKENKNMPTKNHNHYYEQLRALLEDNGMKHVSLEWEYSARDVDEMVTIRGFVPNEKPVNVFAKPKCKGIIRRDKTTRVDWADCTRTIIVLEEGKEDMDMFHTFCIAFTKKMLGSTTKILNTIKECDTDAIEAARKKAIEEANKKAEEETKQLKEEMEKAAFEAAVKQKMFEERVIEEAIRRISIQEERRMNEEAGEDDSELCHGVSIERFAEVLRNVMNREKKTEDIADET